MSIELESLQDAIPRIATGEKPWEFETSDHNFRILGPGCSFSEDFLERCERDGRYARTVEEANSIARDKGITVVGAWFQGNGVNYSSGAQPVRPLIRPSS